MSNKTKLTAKQIKKGFKLLDKKRNALNLPKDNSSLIKETIWDTAVATFWSAGVYTKVKLYVEDGLPYVFEGSAWGLGLGAGVTAGVLKLKRPDLLRDGTKCRFLITPEPLIIGISINLKGGDSPEICSYVGAPSIGVSLGFIGTGVWRFGRH